MFFGSDKDENKSDKKVKKYKFKDLKSYSSDEWMANSTKKYRRVFDRAETTYIRVELSFYNKLFDEEEWEATVQLKGYSLDRGNKKELCSLESKRMVKIDENIVYIRDGWGNPTEGAFWKKGDYLWEAWIDGELVGSQKFYIEEVGRVTSNNNPYFGVEHVKLYGGGYDGWSQKERIYLKKFKRDETQYLWVEFKIKNKTASDWNYEFFFNFYDDAGQPKGQVVRHGYIEKGKKEYSYTFEAGWGNDIPGSWKDDKYTLEIVFMDTLIAIIPFEVGEEAEEGIIQPLKRAEEAGAITPDEAVVAEPEESIEDLLVKLDELIGLEDVKLKIKDHINYLNFVKLRKEKGFADAGTINLHSVFTGNPGTGKTTVVNMLGKIYHKMGLLSKGHVHEVDRADLIGEYIGQTAPKVKKAIDAARGGILFIDEAYALSRKGEDSKDYGKEVIEILIKEMSDGEGDIAIMAAGYPDEMEHFIDSNPGLKSRFTHYFHFDDYLPEELLQIAELAAEKRSVNFTATAKVYLEEQLVEAYRNRDKSFGNARYVFSVIDEAKMHLGLRMMKHADINALSNEELSTIEIDDLKKVFVGKNKKKLDININEKMLHAALDELNGLIGMDDVKKEINELVKLVRFYREIGKDVLNKFSLHTVFIGNPGTGKTTVARIIAKIYKALGLLEKGHVVEVDRQGLVAGYVGQTAIKTQQKVTEAKGGILFIDEAYALSEGGENDFGKEAIEVVLKRMEDMRGEFGVIVAGYPDNMNKFLESNPGLKSRFDLTINFPDYTTNELYQIGIAILAKEGLTPNLEAEEHLKKYFDYIFDKKDKYFGNARTVRKVVTEAIKNQHLRLASIPAAERTREMLDMLTLEDVKEFVTQDAGSGRTLGFQYKKPQEGGTTTAQ
jgi:SpoVK/Ycf46/Vps4 family AAA+-type ATPase